MSPQLLSYLFCLQPSYCTTSNKLTLRDVSIPSRFRRYRRARRARTIDKAQIKMEQEIAENLRREREAAREAAKQV